MVLTRKLEVQRPMLWGSHQPSFREVLEGFCDLAKRSQLGGEAGPSRKGAAPTLGVEEMRRCRGKKPYWRQMPRKASTEVGRAENHKDVLWNGYPQGGNGFVHKG